MTTTAPSTTTSARDLGLASLAAQAAGPLSITPVIHPQDGMADARSRTFWSATANAAYIGRQRTTDIYGETPDLSVKLAQGNDLVDHGRRGPIGCDADAVAGMALWQAADRAALTDRPSAPVAWHVIGWLPANATPVRWRELVLEFLDCEAVANGMIADWAVHALADADGGWIRKPHLHVILTSRFWKAGRRTGEPNAAWLGSPRQRQKMSDVWEQVVSPARLG